MYICVPITSRFPASTIPDTTSFEYKIDLNRDVQFPKETYTRDLQKKPTTETYKTDLQKETD